MPGNNTNNAIIESLTRGAAGIYSLDDLKSRLASGKQLRVKLGLDPTAPDIHLGHSVVLRKMRQFQDLGHKAVLIVGDYTARIGDPTGRNTTRPVLSEEQIQRNAATYVAQAGKILDTSPERLELRFNGEWLAKLSFADVLHLTGQMTVQQMLHRDSFRQRMNDAQEIAITEFLYPLMQAYDSVEMKADIELGGTDQTFNNLCGRDLMPRYNLPPQIVIVMPILVGLDGVEKMSKSKGNYIGVSESADEMFGKVMSIADSMMPNYFELLTHMPKGQVEALLDHDRHSPRDTKDLLARSVVAQYHGEAAGEAASAEFRRRFTEHALPSDIEVKRVLAGEHGLAALLVEIGFASTNSESRRLMQQGGVRIDQQRIDDPHAKLTIETGREVLVQVGKRRVCRVRGVRPANEVRQT